jgi:ribosome-associated protein
VNDTPTAHDDRPSKSHLKREMHARQELGKKLVELNNAQLGRMELSESLLAAIRETQRISGHEARRRQLQYVGKLMRDVDFAALQAAYDDLMGATRESVALMHRCERLRDRMLEDDAVLGEFIAEHPGIDIQWLRAKVRAARQERSAARPPKQVRELYKWLYAELKGAAPEPSLELPGAEAPDPFDDGPEAAGAGGA